MSKAITKIRAMWARLASKPYRDAYISQKIASGLAVQIFSLRDQRGWTQGDLAERAGMTQPRISKLEQSCEGVNLGTLKQIASAFDVAISIKFVPYSQIVEDNIRERIDRLIPPYPQDSAPFNGFVYSDIIASGRGVRFDRQQTRARDWSRTLISTTSPNIYKEGLRA